MTTSAMDTAQSSQELARKNARMMGTLVLIVAGMVGASFAAVPLYDLFCRVTGFGGTTQTADALPDQVLDRDVTVRFAAHTRKGLPWEFTVEQNTIDAQIGAGQLIHFSAVNTSDRPVAGTALFNVTPLRAGVYFHKIQCFCFDEQTIQPGERVDFPVFFYLDPEMAQDASMDEVGQITLSYTFFPAQSQDLEDGIDAFYDRLDQVSAAEPGTADTGAVEPSPAAL